MEESNSDKKSAAALAEEKVLKLWERQKTFEKSVKQRSGSPYFSFYDGPPFANGQPHFGHSLVTAVKDGMLRYKTMRGYQVPRRVGWDCHGLPVEYDVEKEFGVSGKKQIEQLGIDKFNAACRASIFRYKHEWEEFLTRIGRWSDYDNYYATVDTSYTESVWWTLSQVHKKGLLYRGLKSVPYCPRCETPLSNFELNEGYRDKVPDPSVFVLFPLTAQSVNDFQQRLGLDASQGSAEEGSEMYGKVHRTSTAGDDAATRQEGQRASGSATRQAGPSVSLLAWTTTPWTLPANAALAVDPKANYTYVKLKSDDLKLILAKECLDVLDLRKHEYKLLKTVKGKELAGLRYQPLYQPDKDKFKQSQLANAWQVFTDSNVELADGTGVLHVAPRYGETDLQLGLDKDLPLIKSVDGSGHLIFGPSEAVGRFFKEADRHIIADLTKKGRIFAAETAEHTYPFCWRCDTPLMYFATTSWFVAVSEIRDKLIKTAEEINWVPAHIKHGRFGKWLEGARDWAISRNRYWGAPLPIWINEKDEEDYIVVSSMAELEELAGIKLKPKVGGEIDLHRPDIDKIVIKKGAKTYRRAPEVLDCWFESGSMPVAQRHYPFEDKQLFAKSFPADFITEAIDQTRLWFYVQHVISTILFEKPAFKQVIVTGFMMAADGQKLSKRLRNYPPVEEVFAREGADSLRLYLLSRTQGTETADYMRFDRSAMADIQRNVLDTLGNSFKFFKTYSSLDKWQPSLRGTSSEIFRGRSSGSDGGLISPKSDNILDQWILSRLSETVKMATKSADGYKIAHAILPVFELIDDLSNWYIRRSRRRFWKSENDKDKKQAYSTLHYVLVRICQLMAPWAPFISDELWRELTKELKVPKSVHLTDWPQPDKASTKVLEDMKKVRQYIAEGLAQRAEAKIKVRQPLNSVTVPKVSDIYKTIITEELNVKEVKWGKSIKLESKLTDELKQEGVARELIRQIQSARKKAGLNVEDRIHLKIVADSPKITDAVKKFKDTIFSETLATAKLTGKAQHSESVKVEAQEVKISLSKA